MIIDTHIWLWWVLGDKQLKKKWLSLIEKCQPTSELYLSHFSIWEAAMLIAKNRLVINEEAQSWINRAIDVPGLSLLPMQPEIAVESTRLPGDFHGDPADRIIIATARVQQLSLLTADSKIITYGKQGFVKLAS